MSIRAKAVGAAGRTGNRTINAQSGFPGGKRGKGTGIKGKRIGLDEMRSKDKKKKKTKKKGQGANLPRRGGGCEKQKAPVRKSWGGPTKGGPLVSETRKGQKKKKTKVECTGIKEGARWTAGKKNGPGQE